MNQRPDIPDERLVSILSAGYGLSVGRLDFIPRGADQHTSAYRMTTSGGNAFFVKVRFGGFDRVAPELARLLKDRGMKNVIAPLSTIDGELWVTGDAFTLILFPFVEGSDGYQTRLSDHHWRELGGALRMIHNTIVPGVLARRIRREDFSSRWRKTLVGYLEGRIPDRDPLVTELSALIKAERRRLLDLVQRAESQACQLKSKSLPDVLCHSDIHAGNVVATEDGRLYVVDWDEPCFAPKERDLMFIGAGHWGRTRTPQEEQAAFYEGYGEASIDEVAIAYYRYERIVEDAAVFCARITAGLEAPEDRELSLHYLKSYFLPEGAVDLAYASDMTGRAR